MQATTALAKRYVIGKATSIAPPSRWTQNVMALPATESRKNGNFSRTNAGHCFCRQRASGQKSSSNKTNGNVTTIGLAIKPPAKATSASP